jgi:hypothetical protein
MNHRFPGFMGAALPCLVLVTALPVSSQDSPTALVRWQEAREAWTRRLPSDRYQTYYAEVLGVLKGICGQDPQSFRLRRDRIARSHLYGIGMNGPLRTDDPGFELLQALFTGTRSVTSLSDQEARQLNKLVYPIVWDAIHPSGGGVEGRLKATQEAVFVPVQLVRDLEAGLAKAWEDGALALTEGRQDTFREAVGRLRQPRIPASEGIGYYRRSLAPFAQAPGGLEQVQATGMLLKACEELEARMTDPAQEPPDQPEVRRRLVSLLDQYGELQPLAGTRVHQSLGERLGARCARALAVQAVPTPPAVDLDKLKFGALLKLRASLRQSLGDRDPAALGGQVSEGRALLEAMSRCRLETPADLTQRAAAYALGLDGAEAALARLKQVDARLDQAAGWVGAMLNEVVRADAAGTRFKQTTIPLYREERAKSLDRARQLALSLKPLRDPDLDRTVKERLERRVLVVPMAQGARFRSLFAGVYR